MRRVAAQLDTGAASLYVYVHNRDELLREMLDRAFGMVELVEPDVARWRQQIYELLRRMRVVLEAHPGLAAALSAVLPSGESSLAGLENMLGILMAGGISPQSAAWACDILGLIVSATATENDVRRAAGQTTDADYQDMAEEILATFDSLPPERFPRITAHTSELVSGGAEDRFRFAIDTFLDGLVARSSKQ